MELMHIIILVVITIVVLVGYTVVHSVLDLFRTNKMQQTSSEVVNDSLEIQARRAKAKSLLGGIVNALIGMPIVLVMATATADAASNPFSTALLFVLPVFLLAPFVPLLLCSAGKYQETIAASKYVLKAPWLMVAAIVVGAGLFRQ
jgi:NADH:ubiquinone oxidoreductase subunit 3 (subunit A)